MKLRHLLLVAAIFAACAGPKRDRSEPTVSKLPTPVAPDLTPR
jgi:hypothetical protein